MNVKAQYIADSAVVRYDGHFGVFRRIGVTTYVEVYDSLKGWKNCPVDYGEELKIIKPPRDASREWIKIHSRSMPDEIKMYCELMDDLLTYRGGQWYDSEGNELSVHQSDELNAIYLDLIRASQEAE